MQFNQSKIVKRDDFGRKAALYCSSKDNIWVGDDRDGGGADTLSIEASAAYSL